jgi:mono/diheme cytochrome c family protein
MIHSPWPATLTVPPLDGAEEGPWALLLLGKLHLVVLHFPVALLIVAAAVELLHARRGTGERSPVAYSVLAIGAASGVLAAICGWTLANYEDVSRAMETDLLWHRWVGIASVVVALIALWLGRASSLAGYRVALLASAILVGGASHIGGELVHGEGFLFGGDEEQHEPPMVQPVVDEAPAETVDFATQVRPILASRCFSCHGPKKQKAKLRFDRLETVYVGLRAEWVIQPGNAAGSEFVRLIELPAENDDVMPAKGDPLTAEQIATLRTWIDEGARWPGGAPPSDG